MQYMAPGPVCACKARQCGCNACHDTQSRRTRPLRRPRSSKATPTNPCLSFVLSRLPNDVKKSDTGGGQPNLHRLDSAAHPQAPYGFLTHPNRSLCSFPYGYPVRAIDTSKCIRLGASFLERNDFSWPGTVDGPHSQAKLSSIKLRPSRTVSWRKVQCAADTGLPIKYPCTTSQPSSLTRANCASVSMPSATVLMPSARASATIASTIACAR